MTLLDTNAHRLGRRPEAVAEPAFRLRTREGSYLHQDLAAMTLTQGSTYAWKGTLEQLKAVRRMLPASLRLRLRVVGRDGLPFATRRR